MPKFPIPTSGEAEVMGRLKGRFGGNSMRRRRSLFNRPMTPRSTAQWQPFISNGVSVPRFFQTVSGATLNLTRVVAFNGNIDANEESQECRLWKLRGNVIANSIAELSTWNWSNLYYQWTLEESDDDYALPTLMPNAAQDLNASAKRRIILMGLIPIRGNITTVTTDNRPIFVPFPRNFTKGVRLGAQRYLTLGCTVLSGIDGAPIDENVTVQGILRAYCSLA